MFPFGGKSKIKPRPTVVRTERIAAPKKPEPRPSAIKQNSSQNTTTQARQPPSLTTRPAPAPSRSSPSLKVPRLENRQNSSRQPAKIAWGSDDEDENAGDSATDREGGPRKKQKISAERPVDRKRRLRRQAHSFSESGDGGVFDMIHAADVSKAAKRKGVPAAESPFMVRLQYPSNSQLERYSLVFEKDQIDPTQEILDIAKIVTEVYLTQDQAAEFDEPNTGLIRQIEKAKNHLSKDTKSEDLMEKFKVAVKAYNKAIRKLVADGAVASNLGSKHQLPLHMIKCILQQVYDRAVSPKVDLLKQYENGTDNVYGELKPDFISRALIKTGVRSDHVFVDLGSGVGNVVLQAALEFGCESWGCEMMENATTLADAQGDEFKARCRLWGIESGAVFLEKGDFMENQKIHDAMKKADVILVNNQAFTPDLNQKLVQLFLDLKDGCKIVSLRSFVPDGHKISYRHLSDPVNLLAVEKNYYYSNSVSWTDAGGSYFIATKGESALQDWIKANPQ